MFGRRRGRRAVRKVRSISKPAHGGGCVQVPAQAETVRKRRHSRMGSRMMGGFLQIVAREKGAGAGTTASAAALESRRVGRCPPAALGGERQTVLRLHGSRPVGSGGNSDWALAAWALWGIFTFFFFPLLCSNQVGGIKQIRNKDPWNVHWRVDVWDRLVCVGVCVLILCWCPVVWYNPPRM